MIASATSKLWYTKDHESTNRDRYKDVCAVLAGGDWLWAGGVDDLFGAGCADGARDGVVSGAGAERAGA